MKESAIALAMAALALPAASMGETASADDCARIEKDSERLACYDGLFRVIEAARDPTAPPVPPAMQITEEEFGGERIAPARVDTIEARLVGDFNGWNGRTLFRLDNGQVWQQTRNYIANYKPRDPIPQAKVTISRSALGSYNLHIDGIKRIVQVKRVT